MAPAKTPDAIIARINAELARAFNTPEFQAQLSDLRAEPAGGTPGEFRTFMLAHMEKMRKAVVASGARPE
jgi:tripartite-type tricarboxylate transporter receptor subunit TctC